MKLYNVTIETQSIKVVELTLIANTMDEAFAAIESVHGSDCTVLKMCQICQPK